MAMLKQPMIEKLLAMRLHGMAESLKAAVLAVPFSGCSSYKTLMPLVPGKRKFS
jgi:hypothetical protein